MFKWIKKKILKSIIKDVTKELPIYKRKAIAMVEEHKDELIEKAKQAIKNAVMDFIKSKTNK